MLINEWAFDIETYPNLFSLAAIDLHSQQQIVFEWSDTIDERDKLSLWIVGKTLIGYNALSFDVPVLNYVLGNPKGIKGCFNLATCIITDDKEYLDTIIKLRNAPRTYNIIDLAKTVTGNGGRFPSLKQIAIHLHWKRLQDLPYKPETELTRDEIEKVLEYNLNDVGITKALYWNIKPKLDMRVTVGKKFGVDILNASDSKIANVIFQTRIAEPTIKGTERAHVYGRDVMSSKCKFITTSLLELRSKIADMDLLTSMSLETTVFDNRYKIGLGGLHSCDTAGIFDNATSIIRDADVTSYYPTIAINHNYEPEHLRGVFLSVYKDLVAERITAKEHGDTVTADALKIAINGSFGKFNSRFFWLYDPLIFYSITINGQLFLLDLIEKLGIVGIKVISANTDGILCQIKPEQILAYNAMCEDWEMRTNFQLEYTDYELYIRSDVNNYLAKTISGKLKTKGWFATDTNFQKGYDKPIVARAVKEYFLNHIPPENTITAETDIYQFMMTQDIGKQFTPVYVTNKGEHVTQKHNRYYAVSTGGGYLTKVRDTGQRINIANNVLVYLANDVTDTMPEPYRKYYIDEAWKLIDTIAPREIQYKLF